MNTGLEPAGLKLTEDEAYALLTMCLTSPHKLDSTCERALKKLAEYCVENGNHTTIIDLAQYQATTA